MKTIANLSSLKGRVALVTGAAGHIGYTICETLAELGADVALIDFNRENAKELSENLSAKYDIKAKLIPCDLESEHEIELLPSTLKESFGKLDILINCAALVGTSGLEGWATPLKEQSIKTWKRAIDVNLTGAFYLIQNCLPLLDNSNHASIINIGSIYGIAGMDMKLYEGMNYITPAAYAASKGGLTQLTKYLATALAPNIRVNTVTPGGIERGQDDKFIEKYSRKTPLGRMGTEEDLKGAICYLASDLSKYVTGQNIIVDGGWSL